MAAGTMLTLAAFGAGLLATLVLAAWLTPRAWWRRANLRALTVLAGGTAGIGALVLWLAGPPGAAQAAVGSVGDRSFADARATHPSAWARGAHPTRGENYRVYRDLNLRAARGVQAPRLAVVPAGASVSATGRRDGDWWEVSAEVDGRALRGWASSLWLRRGEEISPGLPPAPSD